MFLLCFGVLIYTPVLIIFLHNNQNPYHPSELVVPSIVCLSAGIMSIFLSKVNDRASSIVDGISGAVALYIFISVNIYPLNTGILDGKAIPLNTVSVFAHIMLLIACIALFYKNCTTGTRIVHVLGLLSLVMVCYIVITTPSVDKKDISKLIKVGKADNVFIVVMDMFQGYFVGKYIEQNPTIAENFSGFKYFNNAVSAAPYTMVSTRYILTGKPPHGEAGLIANIDQNDNIISDAINNGYSANYVTLAVDVDLPNLNRFHANEIIKKKKDFFQFAYSCAQRYFPAQFMPAIGAPLEFGWISKTNAKDSFKWFSENLHIVDPIPKTFHYYHNIMTHQPIRFNSLGEYSKTRTPDDVYGEIGLAFNQLNIFLERLKKIGIYDDSTIIITADHGYNILNEFSDRTLPPDAYYLREPLAKKQKGQYDVALMIKAPHSSGAMHRSTAPVILTDIRKTLNEIMVPGSGKKFSGENILRQDLPGRRKVKILSYTGEVFAEQDFRKFDNWKPLEVTIPLSKK
jgi:hypothetical protein